MVDSLVDAILYIADNDGKLDFFKHPNMPANCVHVRLGDGRESLMSFNPDYRSLAKFRIVENVIINAVRQLEGEILSELE